MACPPIIAANLLNTSGVVTIPYAIAAYDPVTNASLPVTCNPIGGSVFSVGVKNVVCSASSSANCTFASTTCSFPVVVTDVTAPVITGCRSMNTTTLPGKSYTTDLAWTVTAT